MDFSKPHTINVGVHKVTKGQVVNALLYGGRSAERRVVSDKGAVIVICNEDEYQAAAMEGRDPEGAGFPREDVEEMAMA